MLVEERKLSEEEWSWIRDFVIPEGHETSSSRGCLSRYKRHGTLGTVAATPESYLGSLEVYDNAPLRRYIYLRLWYRRLHAWGLLPPLGQGMDFMMTPNFQRLEHRARKYHALSEHLLCHPMTLRINPSSPPEPHERGVMKSPLFLHSDPTINIPGSNPLKQIRREPERLTDQTLTHKG